jgi:O-antigen ligase
VNAAGKANDHFVGAGALRFRLQHIAIAIFLLFCVVGGGTSRNDALSQPFIWIAAILCSMACMHVTTADNLARVKVPLIFTGVCAMLAVIHLLPLPPIIWTAFPGRELYAQLSGIAGIDTPWRPLSIVPDFTWSSLLSLLPVVAIILAYATTTKRIRGLFPVGLLCVCVGSAIAALAQLGSGDGGVLRHYEVSNKNFAIGFFANRNHQAVLLTLAIPLVVVISMLSSDNRISKNALWISLAVILFLVPMILVTGARIGLPLGTYALILAAILSRTPVSGRNSSVKPAATWEIRRFVAPTATVGIVVSTLLLARAVAVDRLFAFDADQELRFKLVRPLIKMLVEFFPFGSGLGSFEPVFRQYEPFVLLRPGYVNQAHNDLLQLGIEGGLPALLLLTALVVWLMLANVKLWRPVKRYADSKRVLGRYAAAIAPAILVASLVDYPLRTPLMGVVFVLLLLWVNDALQNLNASRDNGSEL